MQFGSSRFNAGLLIKTDCSSPKGNSALALHCTNTRVPVWLAMSQISLLIQFKPSPSPGGMVDFPLYQLWYSFEPTVSHSKYLNQQKISTTKDVILLLSNHELSGVTDKAKPEEEMEGAWQSSCTLNPMGLGRKGA